MNDELILILCVRFLCFRKDDSKLVEEITKTTSNMLLFSATPPSNGIHNLVGIHEHMKQLHPLLYLNSNEGVRVIGIWARESTVRSALARYLYQSVSQQFQSHCFLENVQVIHQDSLMNTSGFIRTRLMSQKVLLVANNVDKLEQLDALAEDFNCFGPGSILVVTTQNKHLLVAFGVELVYKVELLT